MCDQKGVIVFQPGGWKSRPLVNTDDFLLTHRGSEAFFRFQVSGGVIKIAHNMALKNIPYLFLPVCLVSGFRCQRLCSSFLTPEIK
jgi:hypothetical protein